MYVCMYVQHIIMQADGGNFHSATAEPQADGA